MGLSGAEAMHDAAQFGETTHAADGGIAGSERDVMSEILHHDMAMVGSQRELPVGPAFRGSEVMAL